MDSKKCMAAFSKAFPDARIELLWGKVFVRHQMRRDSDTPFPEKIPGYRNIDMYCSEYAKTGKAHDAVIGSAVYVYQEAGSR